MSSHAGSVPAGSFASTPTAVHEFCPACHAGLAADQQWCLECGAAARTRLAPTPNWRAPLAVAVAVILLSLAGLTIALVHLARPGHSASTVTVTVAAPAAPTSAPAP